MKTMVKPLTKGGKQDNPLLICFPFAGGYSASLRPLGTLLEGTFRVLCIDPPGHANPLPLVDDLERLVDLYEEAIAPYMLQPFYLFGHSMGGMIVFRLTQRLELKGIRPEGVVISAVYPPHREPERVGHLTDKAFLDYLVRLGGIPPELAEERELLEFFLPIFRSDFRAMENFVPTAPAKLRCPVHILNGKQDRRYYEMMPEWGRWAEQAEFHSFEGGHMFVLSETEQVSELLQKMAASDRCD